MGWCQRGELIYKLQMTIYNWLPAFGSAKAGIEFVQDYKRDKLMISSVLSKLKTYVIATCREYVLGYMTSYIHTLK